MNNNDFPNFFQAGDNASLRAQMTYIKFVRWDLVMMVVASAIAAYDYQQENSKLIVYVISGMLLLIATFLSLVIKNKKYEDTWYRGRALAESCKTLSWRYVTCSEYFEHELASNLSDQRFTERIMEINNEFKDLMGSLNAKLIALPIITEKMRFVRSLSLEKRKEYYLTHRIDNQLNWYAKKAENNKNNYENWFWAVIVAQILAIISIVILIKYPSNNYNLVGVFSTFSACSFSWLQLKKYQENKQAYTTATSELNLIKVQAHGIATESTFSRFVLDSENAMSREHTLWLAQKRSA